MVLAKQKDYFFLLQANFCLYKNQFKITPTNQIIVLDVNIKTKEISSGEFAGALSAKSILLTQYKCLKCKLNFSEKQHKDLKWINGWDSSEAAVLRIASPFSLFLYPATQFPRWSSARVLRLCTGLGIKVYIRVEDGMLEGGLSIVTTNACVLLSISPMVSWSFHSYVILSLLSIMQHLLASSNWITGDLLLVFWSAFHQGTSKAHS